MLISFNCLLQLCPSSYSQQANIYMFTVTLRTQTRMPWLYLIYCVEVSPQYDFLIFDIEKYLFLTFYYPSVTISLKWASIKCKGQFLWILFLLALKDFLFGYILYLLYHLALLSYISLNIQTCSAISHIKLNGKCYYLPWPQISLHFPTLFHSTNFPKSCPHYCFQFLTSHSLYKLLWSDFSSTTPLNYIFQGHQKPACSHVQWHFSVFLLLVSLAF